MRLDEIAILYVKVPYIYGGNNPLEGLDCSGLVCESLRSLGYIGKIDLASHSIYDFLKSKGWKQASFEDIKQGYVLFFGKDIDDITHTSISTSERLMVESGGGDSKCTTVAYAAKIGACVRVRPILSRRDFVAALIPPENIL